MNKSIQLKEHIIEIVSDAGEGAQKAGTIFAKVAAKMGHGLWTVEIIPSEIQPPAHTVRSSSGIRIRVGDKLVTNAGDLTNLIFAFNEMNLLSRIAVGSLAKDVVVLIDDCWAHDEDPAIQKQYQQILGELKDHGANLFEIPLLHETEKHTENPGKGKNMFVLGILGAIYGQPLEFLEGEIQSIFKLKAKEVIQSNLDLVQAGYKYATQNLPLHFSIQSDQHESSMVAMNGNQAIALGAIAAGFQLCSMYPITPASSVSHYLAEIFENFGGFVHQAEDEIAAIGVALGANYAGKPTFTVTSGPGMALKTEFMGLAVITETPLVIVDVQRGGPSTGLPTKIEQGDLLSSIFATPGDAPKVVLAASCIKDCFDLMYTARRIAEDFRMLVIILTDANLATGVQLFERPQVYEDRIAHRQPVGHDEVPYHWDEVTGISPRLIPGKSEHVGMTSSLNHSPEGLVRYDAISNEHSHQMRSHKLATLQKSLKAPVLHGDSEGDLLVIGWGSTKGAIEEAVNRARAEGVKVSSLHLLFLNPLPLGLSEIMDRFTEVMTIELNYSDDPEDEFTKEAPRKSQLAFWLQGQLARPIGCFAKVWGRALMPSEILNAIKESIKKSIQTKSKE